MKFQILSQFELKFPIWVSGWVLVWTWSWIFSNFLLINLAQFSRIFKLRLARFEFIFFIFFLLFFLLPFWAFLRVNKEPPTKAGSETFVSKNLLWCKLYSTFFLFVSIFSLFWASVWAIGWYGLNVLNNGLGVLHVGYGLTVLRILGR